MLKFKLIMADEGKVRIGAMQLPNRKKICLCVIKENITEVYGYFISEEKADEFMDELIALTEAEKGEPND